MKKNIKIGEKAPKFELPNGDGKSVKLSDLKNKKVIMFFYPKDNTPGCTIEAIEFTKNKSKFNKAGYEILGISKDSCESHVNFSKKRNLTLTLLSDKKGKIAKKYGALSKLKMTKRTSFVIDKNGMITHAYYNVNYKTHVSDLLKNLKIKG